MGVGSSTLTGLNEVLTWLVYVLGGLLMLAAVVAVILAGLALKFVAKFLRELCDSREESEIQGGGKG